MKTSNKLIITALILIVVCLFGYDCLLKQEYLSGNYKNPYRDFAKLNFRDFDSVDVKSSTAINVKFIQGPFKVLADSIMLNHLIINQKGRKLTIKGNFKQNQNYSSNPYILLISCPKLKAINASAVFTSNNKQVIDTVTREDWNMRRNLVEGFDQDSLTINQSYGSCVILAKNRIKVLTAIVGKMPLSGSEIKILNNNELQQATIDVLNRSQLLFDGKSIQNLHYHLADSAKMTLTGAAQNTLTNAKPYYK